MEFIPTEQDTEAYTDWSIFPELFTSQTGAKIYESINKHPNIGCGSRKALLKDTNKQHQMALRLTNESKTHKPQFRATLRLQRGWSQHNTLATLHAFDKLVSDMSQNSASNKIAQHQGREY